MHANTLGIEMTEMATTLKCVVTMVVGRAGFGSSNNGSSE